MNFSIEIRWGLGHGVMHDGVSEVGGVLWLGGWEALRIGDAQWEGLSATLLFPQRLLRQT